MNVVEGHEEPLLGFAEPMPLPGELPEALVVSYPRKKVKFNNKGKIINVPSAFPVRVAKPKLPGNKKCEGKCGKTISGNKNFCMACLNGFIRTKSGGEHVQL